MRTAAVMVACLGLNFLATAARAGDSPTAPATPPADSAAPATVPNATDATAAASPAAKSTETSAAAAGDPGKAAPSPPAANQADASEADRNEEKQLLASGYRPQVRNGTTYYCKSEMPVGSRIEKKVCITAANSRLLRQRSQDVMSNAQQKELNIVGH